MKQFEKNIEKPMHLISKDYSGKLKLNQSTAEFIKTIKSPIAILSIAGPYRTGKSYLLNQIIQKSQAFQVGNTTKATTNGLWIWGKPILTTGINNKITNVIVMDTQGFGSFDDTHDKRIITLALWLSTCFLYNSKGVIDRDSINDLNYIIDIVRSICSQGHYQQSDFHWILRDFHLQLINQKQQSMTSNQYLQYSLNQGEQKFTKQIQTLKSYFPNRNCHCLIKPNLTKNQKPQFTKQIHYLRQIINRIKSIDIDGRILIEILKTYINAMNSQKSLIKIFQQGYQCKNKFIYWKQSKPQYFISQKNKIKYQKQNERFKKIKKQKTIKYGEINSENYITNHQQIKSIKNQSLKIKQQYELKLHRYQLQIRSLKNQLLSYKNQYNKNIQIKQKIQDELQITLENQDRRQKYNKITINNLQMELQDIKNKYILINSQKNTIETIYQEKINFLQKLLKQNQQNKKKYQIELQNRYHSKIQQLMNQINYLNNNYQKQLNKLKQTYKLQTQSFTSQQQSSNSKIIDNYSQEFKKQIKKIDHLSKQKQNLQFKNFELTNNLNSIKRQLSMIQQSYKLNLQQIQKRYKQNQKYTENLYKNKLKNQIEIVEQKDKQINQLLDQIKQNNAINLEKYQNNIKEYQLKFSQYEKLIEKLHNDCLKYKEIIENQQEVLKQKNSLNQQIKEREALIALKLDNLRQKNQQYKYNISIIEKKQQINQEKIKQLNQDCSKYLNQKQYIKLQLYQLRDRYQSQRKQLNFLIESLKHQNINLKKDNNNLQETIDQLKQSIQTKYKKIQSYFQQNSQAMQIKYDNLVCSHNQSQRQLYHYKMILVQTQNKLKLLQQTKNYQNQKLIEQFNDKQKNLKDQIQKLKQQTSKLQYNQQNSVALINQLKSQKEQLIKKLANRQVQYNNLLQYQRQNYQKVVQNLNQNIQHLQIKQKQYKKKIQLHQQNQLILFENIQKIEKQHKNKQMKFNNNIKLYQKQLKQIKIEKQNIFQEFKRLKKEYQEISLLKQLISQNYQNDCKLWKRKLSILECFQKGNSIQSIAKQ